MPLISIIIPIYNSEKYLEECLNSIKNQTLKDIEVLCLVSECADNSSKIVEEFSKNDSRFKLIKRKKEFAGSSRNEGIKIAQGEYIMFVDSDDLVNEFSCEYFYQILNANSSDIAYFNARHLINNEPREKIFDFYRILKDKKECIIYPKKDDTNIFLLPNFIWAKCFKRDFLLKNNIQFDNLKFAEDVCFQIKSYISAKSIVIKDFNSYYYRINNQNSTSNFDNHYKDLITAYDNMYEYLKTLPYKKLLNSYCSCIVHTLLYFLNNHQLNPDNQKIFLNMVRNFFIKLEVENNIVWETYQKEISEIISNTFKYKTQNPNKAEIIEKIFLFGIPIICVKQKWQSKYYYLFNKFKVIKTWTRG